MQNQAVEDELQTLEFVPDKHMRGNLYSLQFVPDWLNTKEQLKIMGGDCNNIWFIKWYEGYKKRKTQKAKIKEELMHPSSWWHWCP